MEIGTQYKQKKTNALLKNNPFSDYHLIDAESNNSIILTKSSAVKDLEIIISSDLKSTRQADRAASKVNSMLGLMKSTFVSRDLNLLNISRHHCLRRNSNK